MKRPPTHARIEDEADPEDKRPEQRAEEAAFRDSEGLEWRGGREEADALPLEPFSFVRKTAAIALGMSYGSISADQIREFPNPEYLRKQALEAVAEEIESRAKSKKTPKKDREEMISRQREIAKALESLKDEPDTLSTYDGLVMDAAIVLWLCLQPDSVCQRARRKPRDYETVIDKWAEKEGIAGANMGEATAIFGKLMAIESASKGTPKVEGKESGN